MGSGCNVRICESDRKWRRCSLGPLSQQARVIVRYQDANEKHHCVVDAQDAPEYLLDSPGDSTSRICGFTSRDANHFSSRIQRARDHEGSRNFIDRVCESTGVFPVFEAYLLGPIPPAEIAIARMKNIEMEMTWMSSLVKS